MFLEKGIVLSKSLLDEKLLSDLKFDENKIREILVEVNTLCEHCRVQFGRR